VVGGGGRVVSLAGGGGGGEVRTASHVYASQPSRADAGWTFDAGQKVETLWVEYAAR
jgi:hypothetical protein